VRLSGSSQLATRTPKEPLGGRSSNWRHRLLRFHLPLALATAVVLVVFMSLPLFDTPAHSVDLSSGAFPQRRSTDMDMNDGGEHRGRQTRSGEEPGDHGGGPAGSGDHGGGQAGHTDSDERMEIRDDERFLGSRPFAQRFTVATGYVAVGLLALTLLIGPANLLLHRPNPVSNYLARDVGMWAAIVSVVHVFYGLQVHGLLSDFLDYFVVDGRPLTNSFGLGNWTGLAATVIVVGLLATSNNFALRKLKARRWKRIQRLNYALLGLVIAHAFFYGALLRMTSPFTLLLLVSVTAVLVGQAMGVWLWRRRHARTPPY
jgi:sulfoxide reductase heme-binding subunit YedZ